jgi:hypothetical protein
MSEPAAPRKLFREEGQAETIKCLQCGGPIALHTFGARQRVVCPHCGSTLAPEDSGALRLLHAAERQRQVSVLPLHARGTLDGIEWEIIGICWRRCVVDGFAYPWQEFLLFNPYKGFRWLVHSNYDGHWSLGHNLDGAPEILKNRHHTVRFRDRKYQHFQGAEASVTYVEGEFTWEVHVGDKAEVNDFIRPPHGLSIEQASGEDGVEIGFTVQSHLEGREVWKAFKQQGKPPRRRGVGALRPNPWYGQQRALWLSCLAFVGGWWLLTADLEARRPGTTAFHRSDIGFEEPLAQEITIGKPGESTAIAFGMMATPLDNSWAYADVLLVNVATEEAIGFGVEASYYHGVDGGESWSEGDGFPIVIVGGVPGGQYLLQIQPQRDTGAGRPTTYSVTIAQDVYLMRYGMLALAIILAFPLFALLLGWIFERRRWKNSDYAPTSE